MAEIAEITTGLEFPEGPIACSDGSVIVVEIKRGTLTRVLPDGAQRIIAETGRPKALTDDDVAAARAMLKEPDITAKDVAGRLNVSVATLYRYLPAARAVITYGEPAE